MFYAFTSNEGLDRKTDFSRHSPSQADVVTFKAISTPPSSTKYPHAARWYNHIASHESEFSSLPGDASKAYTTYGPTVTAATLNPAKAPAAAAAEEDDDIDLFGSDDEEEDAEAVKLREERLAEYKKKKEGKTKPAAKSIVTLDVKPWGLFTLTVYQNIG
jgi:elongation factor 1-beta